MTKLDRWRMIVGGVVILAIVALGVRIALGQVEEKTSYGLNYIMTILGTFCLSFGQWAFPQVKPHMDEGKPEAEKKVAAADVKTTAAAPD